MGRLVHMTVSGVLVLGLAVAGCGGSDSTSSTQTGSASQTSSSAGGTQTSGGESSEQASSGAPKAGHVPTNVLRISSPAFTEGGTIPVHYTCVGGNISPPLRWTGVPPGTVELVLFISNFEGTTPGGGTPISWAVAGLKPTLKGITAGRLPSGAVVGRNSFGKVGYTVCPPKGSALQHYVVALYALQHPSTARPGFAASALSETVAHTAEYSGLAGFSFKR